jgi:hypothetical protein
MAERVVATISYLRHPRTNFLYGWLSLTDDAPGHPLGGGDERSLHDAAVVLLIELFGRVPFHFEFKDISAKRS